jgi:hypothetical protein
MRDTRTIIVCDGCEEEIKDATRAGHGTIGKVDLCHKCMKAANLEYERVIHNRVPTRRGGFRTLGEPADT